MFMTVLQLPRYGSSLKYPPIDDWMRSGIHTHTHSHTMQYYSVIKKKNETLMFAITWMDLEGIMLNEINQRNTILHENTYIWNLNKQTN